MILLHFGTVRGSKNVPIHESTLSSIRKEKKKKEDWMPVDNCGFACPPRWVVVLGHHVDTLGPQALVNGNSCILLAWL